MILMSKMIFVEYFYQMSIFIKFQFILSSFNFGTNLGLTGGKYLIKTIFDIQTETGIFEIWNVANFKQVVSI